MSKRRPRDLFGNAAPARENDLGLPPPARETDPAPRRCPACGGALATRTSCVIAAPILDPATGRIHDARRRRYCYCKACGQQAIVDVPKID